MRQNTWFTRSLIGLVAGTMLVTLAATPGLAARRPRPVKTTPAVIHPVVPFPIRTTAAPPPPDPGPALGTTGALPVLPGMSSALRSNLATLNRATVNPALSRRQAALCTVLLAVRLQVIAYFRAHPNPFLDLLFLFFIDFELTHNGCTVPSGGV